MQPQEYKLKQFTAGDYKDPHNNTWCDAVFEGKGEPVKWVVKDPTQIQIGQTYYGHFEEKTSQAGKPYTRFYKDQRPEGSPPQAAQAPGYAEGQAWGNALTNAVATQALLMGKDTPDTIEAIREMVLQTARAYFMARPDQQTAQVPHEPTDNLSTAKQVFGNQVPNTPTDPADMPPPSDYQGAS